MRSFRVYRFESFGVSYQVEIERSPTPLLSDEALRAVLPPGTKARRGGTSTRHYCFAREGRVRTLAIDDEPAIACASVRAAQDALEGDLQLHVAAESERYVFIHAGVVAWQGRAMLLPGRTLAGKSTLVAALLAQGTTYYSDEYALIDERGLVHPYPRRLSLRQAEGLPRRFRPRRVGCKALLPGWVIGSSYVPGSVLQLTSLTAGRAALLLVDNAVAARLASARVLAAARRISEVARGFTLVRGEAKGAAKELLLLLADEGMVEPRSLELEGDDDVSNGVAVAGRKVGGRVRGRDARRRGARL